MQRIAIFGGTFDPIHNGHLQTSIALQTQFQFDNYLFLPCKIPTLKAPAHASNEQRIEMLQRALYNYPSFNIDLREIERNTPSYMVETLQSFRKEYPNASISLVIGYDSLLSIPRWHQWQELIKLANIIVINREEYANETSSETVNEFLSLHQSKNQNDILNKKAGTVFLCDAGHYDISSTQIRKALHQKKDVASQIPEAVYQFIKDEELY